MIIVSFDTSGGLIIFFSKLNDSLNFFEILDGVLISHVGRTDVELEVRTEVLEVVVVRKLVCDLGAESDRGLVGPASRNVSDRVTTTANHEERQIVLLYELNAFSVTPHRKIEAAQSIACKQ